jgi:hypothetical protein
MEVAQYDLTSSKNESFRFERRNHVVAGRGTAGCLIPPFEYHTLGNVEETPSITLHIYGGGNMAGISASLAKSCA